MAVQGGVEEALVSAEIEVALGAVVQYEGFAVAVRIEGTGINVEIAVDFHRRDAEAQLLQQVRQRGGADTLADARHNAAGDDNEFGTADAVMRREKIEVFRVVRAGADFLAFKVVHGNFLVQDGGYQGGVKESADRLLQLAFANSIVASGHRDFKKKWRL